MPITAYSQPEDVLAGPLAGLDLTRLGSDADILEMLETLIPATDAILEAETNRDFWLHEDDAVELDGTNADQLVLWKTDYILCAPIIEVASVAVYGAPLNIDNLKVDALNGIIGYQQASLPYPRNYIPRNARRLWTFPKDFRNVLVTLDWGYAAVPDAVHRASMLLAAIMLLTSQSGGMTGGRRMRRIGDFEVAYNATGAYSAEITRWLTLVTMLLQRYRVGRR